MILLKVMINFIIVAKKTFKISRNKEVFNRKYEEGKSYQKSSVSQSFRFIKSRLKINP